MHTKCAAAYSRPALVVCVILTFGVSDCLTIHPCMVQSASIQISWYHSLSVCANLP
jgi:hypothetical protein